ncbi:MAG TPA: copper resistance CopC family protein [Tepidisphaeraceae bacterium]|jgi:hypothetical protein
MNRRKLSRVTKESIREWTRMDAKKGGRIRSAIGLALAALSLPAMASAHAFLDRAEPRVGAEVRRSPGVVKIWFTQQPEHAFSAIRVFDSEGKEVDKKDTRTDPDDAKVLEVSLPADLPPGTYKVEWKVLSIDTHRTQGDFKFTIKP